ncbi:hypothetical protein OHB54_00495 [Streptomyces sp. NBC_01007]|nr:hypothetical protein OHB54_00495 [Streptomyces sp. NBC_01007]
MAERYEKVRHGGHGWSHPRRQEANDAVLGGEVSDHYYFGDF